MRRLCDTCKQFAVTMEIIKWIARFQLNRKHAGRFAIVEDVCETCTNMAWMRAARGLKFDRNGFAELN